MPNKSKNQVAIKCIFTVYFGTIIAKIIPMVTDKIFAINDVLVRDEIVEIPFSCDLKKCKGACCTLESELGAPVKKDEIEEIEKILPIVKTYLSQRNIDEIEEYGFYEIKDDELMIASVNNKDCVFSFYDNSIAKCAIERAYFDGKVSFRKPISCHLFPIRVSDFSGDVLRYEKFSECAPALEKGKEDNIIIAEFCKDSLIRLYGENWYNKLMNYSGR
ncbi:MAG TPA: DUF3109 family protein [Ignavibacteriaceae bacterium]|nr:DUF3109 family protein [Ignavibacteriaceae bacterium]HRN25952.1 DUF3109 family protein [Ignavibacteriaceae bacterium]HRP91674.1 DUF3109 family protein [Ignavibacteriaceae bacterium]HRQ53569.1 DUF3109 family protein [Ignavibacteriaceae bacterium]